MNSSTLEFLLLPIVRQPEHDQGIVPGLLVADVPRRVGRGRDEDLLFLRLTLGGNAVIETSEQFQLLERAAQVYYKSSGAVTGAIRKAVNFLNQEILNRNLQNAGRGLQTIGYLTLGVLRPDRLYLAQCGPTHAFLAAAQEAAQYYDPQLSGRGLGLARTTQVRYLQFEIEPGDLFLLTTQPSPAWTAEFLQKRRNSGLENLRRDLISQVEIDPFALLVQVRPGKGNFRVARPKPTAVLQEQSLEPQEDPELDLPPDQQLTIEPGSKESQGGKIAGAAALSATAASAVDRDSTAAEDIPIESVSLVEPEIDTASTDRVAKPVSEPQEVAQDRQELKSEGEFGRAEEPQSRTAPRINLQSYVFRVVRGIDQAGNSLRQTTRLVLERILPDDALANFPVSVLAFIAVTIPLIVVAISWTVYTRQGQASAYEDYLARSVSIASQAEGETDPDTLRQIFSEALLALDRAEQEQVTDQSQTLRSQIQGAYDNLEWIVRLNYQPIISAGLESGAVISRILPLDEELYLLDAAQGRVLHYEQGASGYELDRSFLCSGGLESGPLVDIAPLPRNNLSEILTADGSPAPRIVGIDANGILLYCRPDGPPLVRPLPVPDSNWGRVEAVRIDRGIMYVLDPGTNAVWYYPGEGSVFTEKPGFFFDEDVPNLSDVIDMTINQDELYLLHAGGGVTTCQYSNIATAPTRCQEPAQFTDARQGRESGPQIEEAVFSQIEYSQPPEPSIYLLDPSSQAVYHFSVRLTLQRQYRPSTPLVDGQEAYAFAIGPDRQIYLAVGENLYATILP